MKEVKLESGAILKIGLPTFWVSKALYQAVLKEFKGIPIATKTEMAAIYKDMLCVGLSSQEIENCLWECMKKCSYNMGKGDLKIEPDTFESAEAREDYLQVCMEVAKENIRPFVKRLYAKYKDVFETILSGPA